MTPDEFDTMLHDAEVKLARLRALYEQYFQGLEKQEPHVARKDLDRTFDTLRRGQPRNTALRFRLQQAIARYGTYITYWQRIARQIEEGTYKRDIARVKKKHAVDGKSLKPEPSSWEIEVDLDEPEAPVSLDETDVDAILGALGGPREKSLRPLSPLSLAPATAPTSSGPPPAKSVGPRSLSPFAAFGKPGARPAAIAPGGAGPSPAPPAPAGAAPRPEAPVVTPAAGSPRSLTPFGAATRAAPAGASAVPARPAQPASSPTPALGAARSAPAAGAAPAATAPAAAGGPSRPVVGSGLTQTPERPAPSTSAPAPVPPRPAPAPGAPAGVGPARPAAPPAASPAPPRPVAAIPARPAPGSAGAWGASPPAAAAPRAAGAPAPSAASPAGLDERTMRAVYERYADARRKNNEGDVRFETLAQSVEKMMPKLREKHAGKKIDFEVVVANGRVGLKPKVGE